MTRSKDIANTIKTPISHNRNRTTQRGKNSVPSMFAVPKKRHDLFMEHWILRNDELALTMNIAKYNFQSLHTSLIQIGRTLLEGEESTKLDATEDDLVEFNESLEKAFIKINSILKENIYLRDLKKNKNDVKKYFVRQRRLSEPEKLKLREWYSKEFRLRGAMDLLQRK